MIPSAVYFILDSIYFHHIEVNLHTLYKSNVLHLVVGRSVIAR